MKALLLDGRRESRQLLSDLKRLVKKHRRPIRLVTILVGRRYDSALYVKLKRKAAAEIGLHTRPIQLPATVSQRRLIATIGRLNRDRRVDGILLQLPLPPHLNTHAIVRVIDPAKDVDGFHPKNTLVVPPPVAAVEHFLNMAKPKASARAVILGRESVFTKQLRQRFAARGWKVAIVKTGRASATKLADIVITVLGRGPQLRAAQVKRGVIVVDVGIRQHGQQTIGDVHPSVWAKAKAVTPVPGGVGPMTIYFVLKNTYRLARNL